MYGSIGKPKVPLMACVKSAAPTFHGPLGRPFQALVRFLVAMSDWFPIGAGIESTQNRSVAYQVLKVELSNSSALERSPGGVSQNHMTNFLKKGADAKSYKQYPIHDHCA